MSSFRMMFRNLLPLVVAALVVAGTLGAPSQADAAFQLRISTDGGANFGAPIVDGGTGVINTSVGAVSIQASAISLISVPMTFGDLQVNGIAAPATYNLVVQASFDGITTEPAPQTLNYRFTGSILPEGSGLTATMQTWIDDNNALFGTTGGGIVANTGSLSPPSSGSLGLTAGTPYSMTMEIRLTGTSTTQTSLSLDNNNSITPSPEPSAVMLLLAGIPVVGLGAWIRRRRIPASA